MQLFLLTEYCMNELAVTYIPFCYHCIASSKYHSHSPQSHSCSSHPMKRKMGHKLISFPLKQARLRNQQEQTGGKDAGTEI